MKIAPAATITRPPIDPASRPATPLVVEGLALPAAVPEVPEVFVPPPVAAGTDVPTDPVPVPVPVPVV